MELKDILELIIALIVGIFGTSLYFIKIRNVYRPKIKQKRDGGKGEGGSSGPQIAAGAFVNKCVNSFRRPSFQDTLFCFPLYH